MKRLCSILLCAALFLSMSACGLGNLKKVELPPLPQETRAVVTPKPSYVPPATPTPEPEPTPEPTPEPVLREEPLGLDGQVIVNFKHTEYEQFDPEEGTQRILLFSYDSPYVTIEGHSEAAAALNGQLAFMDESFYVSGTEGDGYGFNGMLELAEDNYAYVRQTNDRKQPIEFSSTRTVRTERIDRSVVSFVFSYSAYTGGSGNKYGDVGCVFNAETGELLSLEDLSSDYETLRKRLVHELVVLTTRDKSLYEHVYVSYMHNDYYKTLGKLLRPGAWYFDEDGLVFESSLYELGPYEAGIAVFRVPYSKFSDVIDAKWLPSDREESGTIRAAALDAGQEGSVAFLDRVEADRRGQELCLIVEGTVYDVKLTRVSYEDAFYDKQQLWFCSEMKDAAVQLVTKIPEGIPNLMLRYTDAEGKSYSRLITQSSEDGSFQLVKKKDVVPVG